MNSAKPPTADFDQRYQTHLKHLKLKGLQPKTIDAYARRIRRMGTYFDHDIDNLSAAQLTDYFSRRGVRSPTLQKLSSTVCRVVKKYANGQ